MKLITDELARQIDWTDLSLTHFSWIEGGRDLVLGFLVPPSDRHMRVICRWARGLKIGLEFESSTIGYALSWNATILRTAHDAWSIDFDFADVGSLSVICQEIELDIDDPPLNSAKP